VRIRRGNKRRGGAIVGPADGDFDWSGIRADGWAADLPEPMIPSAAVRTGKSTTFGQTQVDRGALARRQGGPSPTPLDGGGRLRWRGAHSARGNTRSGRRGAKFSTLSSSVVGALQFLRSRAAISLRQSSSVGCGSRPLLRPASLGQDGIRSGGDGRRRWPRSSKAAVRPGKRWAVGRSSIDHGHTKRQWDRQRERWAMVAERPGAGGAMAEARRGPAHQPESAYVMHVEDRPLETSFRPPPSPRRFCGAWGGYFPSTPCIHGGLDAGGGDSRLVCS